MVLQDDNVRRNWAKCTQELSLISYNCIQIYSLSKKREKNMIIRKERQSGGVGRERGESCCGPHREMWFDSIIVEEF